MALLTTQQMSSAGAAITPATAAGGGDTADISNGRTFLYVTNGGSSITVTLTTPGVVDGDLAVGDRAVTCAGSGAVKFIGPLNPAVYGNVVSIAYSAVTSVTIAAVSC